MSTTYTHSLDRSDAGTRGAKTEDRFLTAVGAKTPQVKRACPFEQSQHFDFWVGALKVEVKAAKRMDRHDTQAASDYLCLELHGSSSPRNVGWLRGAADLVAFEVGDHFVAFRREALLAWLEPQVESKEVLTYAKPPELYQPYRRSTDPWESFVWVPLSDVLAALPHRVF